MTIRQTLHKTGTDIERKLKLSLTVRLRLLHISNNHFFFINGALRLFLLQVKFIQANKKQPLFILSISNVATMLIYMNRNRQEKNQAMLYMNSELFIAKVWKVTHCK